MEDMERAGLVTHLMWIADKVEDKDQVLVYKSQPEKRRVWGPGMRSLWNMAHLRGLHVQEETSGR